MAQQFIDVPAGSNFSELVSTMIEDERPFNWVSDVNASFVLTSGYLVFMMQLGFALLTVGMVRTKSVKSVCLKNICDAAAGGCGYWLLGWAFAYGDRVVTDDEGNVSYIGNPFIGYKTFAMSGTPETNYYKYLFQYVFAISTATIVSGAVAERMKFTAYLMYAFFITAWVYPVLTHWVWSPTGWASPTRSDGGKLLLGAGAYDTVGSGAVHMCGGVAGLAGAWIVGPRTGRFIDGKPQHIPGHNSVLYMAGVLLLWFGFYGFNPGTMGQIINADGTSFSPTVARCAISTSVGACFGGTTALILYFVVTKIKTGRTVWDLHQMGNGALCGMIVITSGCGTFEPWAATLGGIAGGLVFLPSSWFVANVLKIDDVVDAVSVHGTCGALGVLWEALLSKQGFVEEIYGTSTYLGGPRRYGWWQGDDATLLATAVIWILVIFAWTFGMMAPFFYLLKVMGQLRVSPEEEMAGADESVHGGPAYIGPQSDYENGGKGMTTQYNGGYNVEKDGLQSRVKMMETEMAQMQKQLAAMTPHANGNGKATNGSPVV